MIANKTVKDHIKEKLVQKEQSMNNLMKLAVAAGAVVLVIILLNPFYGVGIGQVAVVFNTWSGKTRTAEQGLHAKVPFIETVHKFDVRTQKEDYKAIGASKDLQEVTIEMAVNYHLRYTRVNDLFTTVGRDYVEKVVEPAIMEIVKAGAAKFPVEQIIVQRDQLKEEIESELRTKLSNYFIVVESVNLVDIEFTPEFNKVVEEKQIEEQKIRTAQYIRMQAEENKKTEILKAEAEAAKQRMLQQSATKEIVSLKWIEKWNGVLPQVNAGNESMMVINPTLK